LCRDESPRDHTSPFQVGNDILHEQEELTDACVCIKRQERGIQADHVRPVRVRAAVDPKTSFYHPGDILPPGADRLLLHGNDGGTKRREIGFIQDHQGLFHPGKPGHSLLAPAGPECYHLGEDIGILVIIGEGTALCVHDLHPEGDRAGDLALEDP